MREQSFKPSNALTFDTVQSDNLRLLKLMSDNSTTSIRLDLQDVTQCDSAGLALIIEAKRLCRQHKKTLEIVGVSAPISSLAEFCGVEAILGSVDNSDVQPVLLHE